jgi:hypothetical protein
MNIWQAGRKMSDDLVKRLRATTDGATVNPDGPEAAARIAELEAALDDALTYVWRAHGWSKLKPETQAYKFRKKDE